MALEFTKKIELGYTAPEFSLLEPLSGETKTYKELKSDVATVVMFICNHCPYVKHINAQLVSLANDYMKKGIAFIAINSNDAEKYPDDSPEKMVEAVHNLNYPFPYLFDETQQVAKDYHAVCTPDFSIFTKNDRCIYRGQLDEARPGNDVAVTGKDIRLVLDAIIAQQPVPSKQIPSAGCSIKWKY